MTARKIKTKGELFQEHFNSSADFLSIVGEVKLEDG
jgi:hypothetical protein